MTVTEIRTKRAVLEDGVDEQPGSDCLLLKDAERSARSAPAKVQRRGLAQVTPQTIRLHRVLAALLRDRDTTSRGAGTGLTDLTGVLAAAVPDEPWEVWIWRLLIPHALAVVEHASDDPNEEHADDIT